MTFREFVEEVKPSLERALAAALPPLAGGAGENPEGLAAGGKRLRGALTCLVAEALGAPPGAAAARGAAVELVHAATLLHDDFIDQHAERRGRPALWTLVGPRRAVLAGDALLAAAIALAAREGAEEVRALARGIALICAGAWREPLSPEEFALELTSGRAGGGLYGEINRLKTGVLFGVAARLGAHGAGLAGEAADPWEEYGTELGVVYQLTDDMVDLAALLEKPSLAPLEAIQFAPALLAFDPDGATLAAEMLKGERFTPSSAQRPRLASLIGAIRCEREERLAALEHAACLETLPPARRAPLAACAREIVLLFEGGN